MTGIVDKVKVKLNEELDATHVECLDFSDDVCTGAKLEVVVVSTKFEGVPLIKRHRMVNGALSDFMDDIHAVTIKAWTPAQFESKK